ncbi:uncharacterized protein LOC118743917 [Rhagoletis pomonella]|uniref:uncharacterized protein LOC118743917 n=1 Tax=Rhagoletis pomonella TaxID=28610 RepID=UPI0017866711|nr:uncharacterized protein LOC118743917 [Rhagoletis pomonella]
MPIIGTHKNLILLLQIIFAGLSSTLTVDNQLVSARNDCFERIALEAMLPFEKTFRTEDTNSLKMCKEKCTQAGDKCQSISFGVHRRGNGTCQLSTQTYSTSGGRPSGVLFDPDFDLYARKSNCFDLNDNTITYTTLSVDGGGDDGYSGLSSTATVQLPNRPADPGTTLLVLNPTPTTSTTFSHERPTTGYSPGTSTTYGTTPGLYTDSVNPTLGATTPNGDRLYFSQDIYPLYKYPMLYEQNYPAPNDDVYIPGGYASNVPEVNDHYRPPGHYANDDAHTPPHGPPRPVFGLGYGNGFSYGRPESYDPTTTRPYDQSSQADRDRDQNPPGGYTTRPGPPYASDRPDRPGSYPNERPGSYPSDRPDRPASYPNDHSDGPGSFPNERPGSSGTYSSDRPDWPGSHASGSADSHGSYPIDRPDRPIGPPNVQRPTRPDYDPTTPSNYYTRPEYDGLNRRPSYEQRPPSSALPPTLSNGSRPPGDFVDYTNRPDPTNGLSTSMRPPMREPSIPGGGYGDYGYVRRNGTAARPDGGYDGDKTIATYFNPEDYLNGSKRRPGNSYNDRVEGGFGMDKMTACFRRVLAGKRISPRWVRRTFACERIEDCMRQCGIEKRFMCEGFNYRLDPSGHGRGDCELIDIPLAQIDLYSSSGQRDSNLLRHPDYDYYERDRNAPPSCRRSACRECSKGGTLSSPPLYFKPGGWSDKPPYRQEHHYLPSPPSASDYGSDEHHYRPPSSTAIDHYHPSGPPPPSLSSVSYDHRPPLPPPPSSSEYHHSSSLEFSSHGSSYFEHTPPSGYGSSGTGSGPIDRYDLIRPEDHHRPEEYHRYRPSRPDRWESIPSSPGYDSAHYRPAPESDRFRPPYRPGPDYSPYRPSSHELSGPSGPPDSYRAGPPPPPPPPPSTHNYLDRDGPPAGSYKGSSKFVPYLIGQEKDWGRYGGSYGGSYSKQSSYWGLNEYNRRRDPLDFNYFELGGSKRGPAREPNSVLSYPGSSYGGYGADGFRDRHDYRHSWTRRPGPDECSAKIGEGFRLHKTAIKHSTTAPTLVECERLCSGQDGFTCHTYSYRYNQAGRDNCMLCDRPINSLDYYVDIEPDRDYDIYSMSDDLDVCSKSSRSDDPGRYGTEPGTALADPRNAQCFFRAIDATRFYKSIVRDSLTVRSVGECEMECIKSNKFTCRAFAYRYGQQRHASVIDNCQLSDWPVRDMDKQRHLIQDAAFYVFERASYGHGCEIQPIVDEKHKKSVCYLGYGSPAKLLSTAIKKVISVPSELACKKECIRFRETTSFKCYSFSYGSRATSYNCELSDLDQTELKLNVHYTHTDERDYWLFAWNPFDWTCRDKVNTIGGSRVNNDRRMDIFREPGDVAWRHYTVAGKACRPTSPCEKNLLTGFYSCEIEGGEIGSWDYCCKAEHPCGYSQGFDYPWCFVGDEADQWRKCSDRYFPGNKTATTPIPHTHSSIKFSTLKSEKKKSSSGNNSSNKDYQRPPRPGGLQSLNDFTAARLWPVTYLYSEGPPNSTELSNFVDCNKESC